jgi:hypothetical protein
MIELKGPSAAEIKKIIREKSIVEFNLINGKTLTGSIVWADENAFHIQSDHNKVLTVLRTAIAYYFKK